ncbi:MAG: TM0996/MTH895 family glutaredoxin-like protein [Deltaproteobacteria bacterium]|nr:TM0996/MTH895 family glutaredoxin-like protein [Deltaproteobacteria bacterium]
MEIKVLGPGCPKCTQTENIIKEAVKETGVEISIEKISDIMQIAEYGVMMTPAVVVDGEVKCVGKIPSKEDIRSWIGLE